jgi:bifunctional non-homologous end joining protein LigD
MSSPAKAPQPPTGETWLHEIKHDGFRVIARKDGDRVRLYSRPGNDMTRLLPADCGGADGLRSRSCTIDGEAVACDDNGLASFERIRYRQHDGDVFLYAFDLIESNGDDLRRDPLQVRKATLASILAKARPGIRFNEHIEGDGPTVFEAEGLGLPFGTVAGLVEDEASRCAGRETGGRGRMGQKEMAMTGKNALARTRFTCRAQRGAQAAQGQGNRLAHPDKHAGGICRQSAIAQAGLQSEDTQSQGKSLGASSKCPSCVCPAFR